MWTPLFHGQQLYLDVQLASETTASWSCTCSRRDLPVARRVAMPSRRWRRQPHAAAGPYRVGPGRQSRDLETPAFGQTRDGEAGSDCVDPTPRDAQPHHVSCGSKITVPRHAEICAMCGRARQLFDVGGRGSLGPYSRQCVRAAVAALGYCASVVMFYTDWD